MAKAVKPIPDGFHTVTPALTVRGAAQAIEFYKKAFGAEEVERITGPDGRVAHAEIRIGDSILMLGDEAPQWGSLSPQSLNGTPTSFYLYVKDVDAAFKRAVDAGAQVKMPVDNMFWGDRHGSVADPFGHVWSIATRKEDLTSAEIEKRSKAAFAKPPEKTGKK